MLGWGGNSEHGEERDISKPVWLLDSAALENVQVLAVGENECCVLNTDGSVRTFGNDSFLDRDSNITTIAAFETLRIVDVFAGEGCMFAVDDDGRAYGWGDNSFGQLGRKGYTAISVPKRVQLPGSKKVVQISCGIQHTLLLSNDGSVYSVGGNEFGQLGIGPCEGTFVPTEISSLRGLPITQVVALGWQSFCVTVSGNVFCWGRNDYGQLGLGDRVNRIVPRPLRMLHSYAAKYIAGGNFHTAILTKDGGLFTFGSSSKGQLGYDTVSECQEIPRKVSELMGSVVTQVACGKFHTIAYVPNSENVFAWGSDEQGQLGQGEKLDSHPVPTIMRGPWKPREAPRQIVKEIFACGNRSFVVLSSLSDEFSIDFRETPFRRRIWSIDSTLCNRVSRIDNSGQVPTDIMQQLQCIFSSQSCLNASFLSADDHHNANDRSHGLNMTKARSLFLRLMSCANKDVIRKIQSCLSTNMLPSLIDNPLGIEALRVYILLPELGIFHNSLYNDTIVFPFVEKLLRLGENRLKVLDHWYRSLEPDFFTTPIEMCQRCIVTTVKTCLPSDIIDTKYFQLLNCLHTGRYPPPDSISTKLNPLLELMKKLNIINKAEERNIVDYHKFYIPELTDPKFLAYDYMRWVEPTSSNKVFRFCQYPFVYNSEAKTILLQTDSIFRQTTASDVYLRNLPVICGRAPQIGSLFVTVIKVRRENLLEDGMNAIRSTPDFKLPLRVKFDDEEGLDWGGVRKEFFMLILEGMLDPKYKLFRYVKDSSYLWFNDFGVETDDHKYLIFGTLCGLAIYNTTIIDINFPLAFYKMLLGIQPDLSDLKELDPSLGFGMQQLVDFVEDDDGDIEEDFCLDFTVTRDVSGTKICDELIKNGANINVTKGNRNYYVNAYLDYVFNKSIRSQFQCVKTGFLRVCGGDILKLFRPEELREMVVGIPNYDWQELQKSAEYAGGFERNHKVIVWFWEVFYSLSTDEKKTFVRFLTGSSKIPIGGLKFMLHPMLMPVQDTPPIVDDFLPIAQTCSNILFLPIYSCKESLEIKLKLAIQAKGFFMA